MISQEELNRVSLEEAASLISAELIKEKSRLEQEKKRLLEQKVQYEKDYIAANDGDSSENAPLDKAKENLRFNTGEIVNNAELLQKMRGLEDVDYLLGTYDFSRIISSANTLPADVLNSLFTTSGTNNVDEFIDKIHYMKHEDIAVIVDEFYENNKDKISSSHTIINELLDFYSVAQMPRYNYCGIIVIYTTVRLRLNGQLMTYRIYPEGISFLDIGAMSISSRLAENLIGKKKGDTVSIQHNSNKQYLNFEIVDIY